MAGSPGDREQSDYLTETGIYFSNRAVTAGPTVTGSCQVRPLLPDEGSASFAVGLQFLSRGSLHRLRELDRRPYA